MNSWFLMKKVTQKTLYWCCWWNPWFPEQQGRPVLPLIQNIWECNKRDIVFKGNGNAFQIICKYLIPGNPSVGFQSMVLGHIIGLTWEHVLGRQTLVARPTESGRPQGPTICFAKLFSWCNECYLLRITSPDNSNTNESAHSEIQPNIKLAFLSPSKKQ